ncbi:MAG: putative phage abortive infection protein, partial [Mesorhizobium sp.]|nr:putative phage abortive infection protein [Mesorhizobium sp.]
ALWLAAHWLVPMFAGEGEGKAGQFGDQFGWINALFSGFAFAGIIVTILLQRTELALQRKELRLTRDEMSKSTAQLAEQSRAISKQNFESTFFQLVGLHNDIVKNVQKGKLVGRDCLRNIYYSMEATRNAGFKRVVEVLEMERQHIGHYFRNLYRIYKFVDETFLRDGQTDFEKAKFYTGIIRAQLSQLELTLVFYNGLTAAGENFVPLIEKYAVFEPLDRSKLLFSGDRDKYSVKAFGDSEIAEDRPLNSLEDR